MSVLSTMQRQLVRSFDSAAQYWTHGLTRLLWVSGVDGRLDELRRGNDRQRPIAVTLTPDHGRLLLGLVVSRPQLGQLTFDRVLGRWDLARSFGAPGALNAAKPRHRRAAVWGLQMLQEFIADAQRLQAGEELAVQDAVDMPRASVVFAAGQANLDPSAPQRYPEAALDHRTLPGHTLAEACLVSAETLAAAVNENRVVEDYRPLLGQRVLNPFRFLDERGIRYRGQYVPLAELCEASRPETLLAARQFLGRRLSAGSTDADIVQAVRTPAEPMTLSRFSRQQLLCSEAAGELPPPYGGSLAPTVAPMKQLQCA